MRSDDSLLLDIFNAARKLQRFTAGMSRAAFNQNELVQSAVVRELQVIGEAARLITDETKHQQSQVNWHAISGMRNRLIHEYFDVDFDIVWDTIQQDIPLLISQLEPLIPPPPDDTQEDGSENDAG